MKILIKIFVLLYFIGVIYLLIVPFLIHHYNPALPDQYVEMIYQHTVVAYFKKNIFLHILYLPWIYPIIAFGPFNI